MKKLFFLLFLFFFIPTVYASTSINCRYTVEGYSIVVKATDAEGGKVSVTSNRLSKATKRDFDTSALEDYSNYSDGSSLKCPEFIYDTITTYKKKNKKDKVTVTFKKTKKAKENAISSNSTSVETEQLAPTDWGKVEDTDIETICSKPELRKPLKFIGTLVSVLKIAIPVLIIVFGIIDLFKAIPSSKDDRIMVAVKSIGVRFIAGLFIFFIPGIVQILLDWVNEWSNYENTWCCCTQCILDSGKCDVNSCSSDSCKIGGMN